MKIVHVCLCGPFFDGWSYQENLLPKYHAKAGNKVTVVTSQIGQRDGVDDNNREKTDYINEDGVHIIRLPIRHGRKLSYRFKRHCGVIETIKKENPEILFIHDCQFLDILKLPKYLKGKKIRIYVDNHADFSNSATNLLSRHVLHEIIWKYCANKIEPYVTKFYGVLPARVDFLINVYHLPKDKVHLLVMGADDELVEKVVEEDARAKVRKKYDIRPDDFLLVTGGKIDMAKRQTLLLLEAVKEIKDERLKLILFGSIIPELKEKILDLCDGNKIQYVGWIDNLGAYEYFAAADLAVFPGRHSVYWEQAAGQGVPMLVKDWDGTHHVDLGGNVVFLYEDNVKEIKEKIEMLIKNPEQYKKMKRVAMEKGMEEFSYKEIAERSIGE